MNITQTQKHKLSIVKVLRECKTQIGPPLNLSNYTRGKRTLWAYN